MIKPINAILENVGDFTGSLTPNALVPKKYVDDRNHYTHTQSIPAALWTITHNLGYKPGGILVTDSGGSEWEGDVTHVSNNQLTIDFGTASFGGTAEVS